jgi:dolichyl-phosphate beta-glucosyltransferase
MKSLKSQPDLSIVMPAYREALRIGSSLDQLSDFLRQEKFFQKKNIEVIVVAADAPDNTHEVVLSKKGLFIDFKLLKPGSKVGKGRDVRYGMLRAHGKAIIFMDADLATPLYNLIDFYKAYEHGEDIVVGVRNLHKHHPSIMRRIISSTGNILFRIAGGVWLEDSQCGFKLFSYDAAQICFSKLKIMGWGFDMEVLAIAKANNLSIKPIRINDWVSIPGGTFATDMLGSSIQSLKELGCIAYRRVMGSYRSSS